MRLFEVGSLLVIAGLLGWAVFAVATYPRSRSTVPRRKTKPQGAGGVQMMRSVKERAQQFSFGFLGAGVCAVVILAIWTVAINLRDFRAEHGAMWSFLRPIMLQAQQAQAAQQAQQQQQPPPVENEAPQSSE